MTNSDFSFKSFFNVIHQYFPGRLVWYFPLFLSFSVLVYLIWACFFLNSDNEEIALCIKCASHIQLHVLHAPPLQVMSLWDANGIIARYWVSDLVVSTWALSMSSVIPGWTYLVNHPAEPTRKSSVTSSCPFVPMSPNAWIGVFHILLVKQKL